VEWRRGERKTLSKKTQKLVYEGTTKKRFFCSRLAVYLRLRSKAKKAIIYISAFLAFTHFARPVKCKQLSHFDWLNALWLQEKEVAQSAAQKKRFFFRLFLVLVV